MENNIVKFIQSNRNVLDLILDLVPIPLFVKDRAGRYIDCNKAFTDFLAISREEIIQKTVYEIWKKEEADIFFAQDNELFARGGSQIYEAKITSLSRVCHIVQFNKQVFTDSSGEIGGFLGAIFDITEKKRLENELSQLADTDELTGLPNRRNGMRKLEILHEDGKRKKRAYCIAMIDIDHFKQLNDQYGHSNGDLVLREFADLTKRTLRSGDVCFRYGGEEFITLLPETELDKGLIVVERLRKAWERNLLPLPEGQLVCSTISIGLAQLHADCITVEQIFQASDKALYAAKNSGRNRTVCFQPDKKQQAMR